MEYNYENITSQPNITGIKGAIGISAMTDKTYKRIFYDSSEENLLFESNSALSNGDKTILDGIVGDNS